VSDASPAECAVDVNRVMITECCSVVLKRTHFD
jgi:hypothetical protein